MALLVRTWNLFHGRTVPEGPKLELERMVRLASEDGPALVGLQEVPVWALERLGEWSGMRVVPVVAMPALAGPLARWITEVDPRRFRSALAGQANVLLLGTGLEQVGPQQVIRLNPGSLRRSRRLGLRERLAWGRNRRMCQVVRARTEGSDVAAVNLHASKQASLARLELERLAGLLPDGQVVVVGDFNARQTGLPGFSAPIGGIDQILVRGIELESGPTAWPEERRRHGSVLLSDHAPVEATLSLGSRPS